MRLAPRHSSICFFGAFLVFVPQTVFGAVRMSEVAWMGSSASANDEWIELYNDGASAVSLEGWTLVAQDGSPNVALTGSIPAQGFFLLERTDDDTVPGVSAGALYTGSLANEGEMLRLLNAQGAEMDRVNGSDTWALGGDNVTKDTLQFVDGAWQTGVSTPGRTNTATVTPRPESETSATQSAGTNRANTTKNNSNSSTRVVEGAINEKLLLREVGTPQRQLHISAGEDRMLSVGHTEVFEAVPFDEDGDSVPAAIMWNFGDGTVAKGHKVSHAYAHEGIYVVLAKATASRFGKTFEAQTELLVSVQSARVYVSDANATFIELSNNESFSVDVSGFSVSVKNGGSTSHFSFPEGTMILPNASLKIPYTASKLSPRSISDVALYYPNNTFAFAGMNPAETSMQKIAQGSAVVASVQPIAAKQATQQTVHTAAQLPAVPVVAQAETRENTTAQSQGAVQRAADEIVQTPAPASSAAASAYAALAAANAAPGLETAASTTPQWLWFFSLAAFLLLACIAVILLVRQNNEVVSEVVSQSIAVHEGQFEQKKEFPEYDELATHFRFVEDDKETSGMTKEKGVL